MSTNDQVVAPVNSSGNTYVRTFRNFEVDETNLKIQLTDFASEITSSLNLKENGIYETVETQTGGQFNNPSNTKIKKFAWRKIFYFTNQSATFTIAHGITNIITPIHLYGMAITSTSKYWPLPYVGLAAGALIGIEADATTIYVNIGAGIAPTTLTSGVIIFEYAKN